MIFAQKKPSIINIKEKIGAAIFFICLVFLQVNVYAYNPAEAPASTTPMSPRQYEELEKASAKLHVEAQKLFDNENYWECARNLIILLDFNSNYSKIDEALFTLGDCLYEIGLYEGSKKIFKYLVKKFISSEQLPRALLGLQRIEYDNENLIKCIDFYKVISRGSPSKEILDCSRYYAGLSFYKLNDYNNAIDILSQIDKSNPYYAFGQYTCGLSYLRLKKVRKAVDTLNGILRLAIVNDEIRSIVDETHLTLGYIYYELGYFEHAWHQFTSVSYSHSNYRDALLSAGWAATKLQDYERAITPLTQLVSFKEEDEKTQEGFFLLGQCYLKLGLYDDALKVYEFLVNILPQRELVPVIIQQVGGSIAQEEKKIEKIKMDLLVLETKLLNLIQLSPDMDTPAYLQQEKEGITNTRNNLLTQIQTERKSFAQFSGQIKDMKEKIQIKKERQDWRAFAEYGKSRAMYLKRTESQN